MKTLSIVAIVVGGIAFGGTLGFAAASLPGQAAKASGSNEDLTCSAGGAPTTADTGIVEVNGNRFSREDLPQDVRSAIYDIEHEGHEKITWALKEFAVRLALATEKNGTANPSKLPSLLELIPAPKPDETLMKSMFENNQSQMPPGTTYDQVKPQIEQYLARQYSSQTFQGKTVELEKAGKIRILAQAPVPPVVTLDLEGFPSRGPKDAPVTLVEISDYLCPHCATVLPEVEAVVKEYEGKIRFIQVNFSLDPEGLSGQLTQGAFCAQKQSEEGFWKFHHNAFAAKPVPPADAKKETIAIAEKSGVKNDAFEKCLGSDEAKSFVSEAVEKMAAVGVTGTPTFYLNGRKIEQPASLKESVAAALAEVR